MARPCPLSFAAALLGMGLGASLALSALGQQPIGRTSAPEVKVAGAVEVANGEMVLGNGSTVTAGDRAVSIALTRGGSLRLCQTTSVHLAKDRSVDDPGSTALMMALDRGAIEASYAVGKYSDVLLTPDLRILISGPGEANLSIRLNRQGDTCIDNHGVNAPYVTVTSQLEGGLYRIRPGQRVSFQHGSLREVVDHEPEPCGCPAPPAAVSASAATALPAPSTATSAAPATAASPAPPAQTPALAKPVGGPSSTPADTAFPLAQSEGLTSTVAPATPPEPIVPAGEAHAQLTVPLTYNADAAAATPAAATPASAAPPTAAPVVTPMAAAKPATTPRPAAATGLSAAAVPAPAVPAPAPAAAAAPVQAAAEPPAPHSQRDVASALRSVGHFFRRIFGG